MPDLPADSEFCKDLLTIFSNVLKVFKFLLSIDKKNLKRLNLILLNRFRDVKSYNG